ncbi:MAG: hypothetical protein KatS3mg118_2086 [Paracoccaceae bacterium]|nr:MAG: hypothetical protein KatS3mg118_2086 [Paracoccaceae bacterium]
MLLIDELDRTDEPFEAFLLEALADFQVTIPRLGTVTAPVPPIVVLTSNRTREVHDALKRRCLYHWVDYPDVDREMAILRARAPEASARLARRGGGLRAAAADRGSVQEARASPRPSTGRKCLVALDALELVARDRSPTRWARILKYQDDIAKLQGSEVKRLLDQAKAKLEPA